MTGLTLRLGMDEIWTLLDHVDLVGVLRDGLHRPRDGTGELTVLEPGLLRFHDTAGGSSGDVAAEHLWALRTAGLAALAARLLLVPGAVTVGVVGPWLAAQWHVAMLGRYVPNVSHIALFATDRARSTGVDARVRDQLDLSGIGLSPVSSLGDAVLGATLVVTLGRPGGQIGYEQLARGSVLVTTDHRVVSADLREGIARRYAVDDLLDMLVGEHPVRTAWDEILMVNLPDQGRCRELDVVLAHRLIQCASRLRVGVQTRDGATS